MALVPRSDRLQNSPEALADVKRRILIKAQRPKKLPLREGRFFGTWHLGKATKNWKRSATKRVEMKEKEKERGRIST